MTTVTDRLDDAGLRSADAVQVENLWMEQYARAVTKGRVEISYAPPGVDTGFFTPNPNPNRLHSASPYVLCVGRLNDPRKNIDLLLEAFARVSPQHSGLRLLLAGSSAPSERFWSRVGELRLKERVEFVLSPNRSDLLELYRDATMFVLPSDEEGLGVVVLEAMACGIPVISTLSGGPDGIIDDGVDGYLVPLDDDDAMADRMNLLMQQQINYSMGANARAKIESSYSESVTGAKFLAVWERLKVQSRVGR
jgi:D-inositol-3-phosphate glycosyltransferase